MNQFQRYFNDIYLGDYALHAIQTSIPLPTTQITDDQLRNLAKEVLEYRQFFSFIKKRLLIEELAYKGQYKLATFAYQVAKVVARYSIPRPVR